MTQPPEARREHPTRLILTTDGDAYLNVDDLIAMLREGNLLRTTCPRDREVALSGWRALADQLGEDKARWLLNPTGPLLDVAALRAVGHNEEDR